MLPLVIFLVSLTAWSQAAQCPAYGRVTSGVFQPSDDQVNYNSTQAVCACYKATVASLEQLEIANNRSYQSCKWGWVKEQKVIMPRATPDEKCANSSTGIIHRMPCVYIEAQSGFCFKRNVVKGVFQVFDQNGKNLTQQEGATLCKSINATVATTEQVERANRSGYVTCSGGWVGDVNVPYHFLNTSGANCSLNNQTSPNKTGIFAVFCFREQLMDTGLYMVLPQNGSSLWNKTEARDMCVSLRDNLATIDQIKNSSYPLQPKGLTGWCQEGIVKTGVNGAVELLPCVNYPDVNATVFCYDPNLPDSVGDTFWKKIMMGCILASIFIILLIASLSMKGNQFICCIEKPHPVNEEGRRNAPHRTPSVPTWNTTGIYHPVREVTDPRYKWTPDVLPEPRPPAIRPEMLNYRSHYYDNLGYDRAPEE